MSQQGNKPGQGDDDRDTDDKRGGGSGFAAEAGSEAR